jgi:lipopolysaccharide/colanic/teichoic acid biosynthesis glycosyltransferase
LNNKHFTQYRFRLENEARSGVFRKATRPSGFLATIRKFHLDGLPQLFNVLKGEMVFVGPRPQHAVFVEALSEVIPYYPQRHCVRPGMTGWAQIQDDPRIPDTLAALEYDFYYIRYMSMSLDILIVFQTLRSMFVDTPEE